MHFTDFRYFLVVNSVERRPSIGPANLCWILFSKSWSKQVQLIFQYVPLSVWRGGNRTFGYINCYWSSWLTGAATLSIVPSTKGCSEGNTSLASQCFISLFSRRGQRRQFTTLDCISWPFPYLRQTRCMSFSIRRWTQIRSPDSLPIQSRQTKMLAPPGTLSHFPSKDGSAHDSRGVRLFASANASAAFVSVIGFSVTLLLLALNSHRYDPFFVFGNKPWMIHWDLLAKSMPKESIGLGFFNRTRVRRSYSSQERVQSKVPLLDHDSSERLFYPLNANRIPLLIFSQQPLCRACRSKVKGYGHVQSSRW